MKASSILKETKREGLSPPLNLAKEFTYLISNVFTIDIALS